MTVHDMTQTEIAGYFLWHRGSKGFIPSKRAVDVQPRKDEAPPVASYPLNAEQFGMKIAVLEQRFPCSAKLEDERA